MKNKLQKTLAVLSMGITILFGSCSDDPSTSNAEIKVKMIVKSTEGIINGGRVRSSGLEFNQVILGVTEFEFETSEENQQEEIRDDQDGENGDGELESEKLEYTGEFVVDLIAGTSTPDFGVAQVLPGTYQEVEITLEPILD